MAAESGGGVRMRNTYVISITKAGKKLFVSYSDGTDKAYDLTALGVDWFKMSNDAFFEKYGFNFNPHEYPGLYLKCRRIVYPGC